jgi:glyoxylase-like metal-dependent hydrolase (beta-lactamase superfamily II)
LGGKLTLLFLGGIACDLVPLLFGEQFVALLYDGVAIDPGAPRMRRSLARHLRDLPGGSIRAVAATHHHEEHVGNLNWLARRTDAPIYVTEATARLLQLPPRLPWARALAIGQPPPLEPPLEILGGTLPTATGSLRVIPAPGHCDDQIVLYDPRERLLLAGHAFMGVYFATPNPDVDSRR